MQERFAVTLRFLASRYSYITVLSYLFNIYKHLISDIVPEVSTDIIDALKDLLNKTNFFIYIMND